MVIEFPAGRKTYTSNGSDIESSRVSRREKTLAFLEHPVYGDDAGQW